jgi:hypothetical protein
VATAVADGTGDGIADILVSNRESNNVYLLPVGNGFFDDRVPVVSPPAVRRSRCWSVSSTAILASTDDRQPGSNNLTFYSNRSRQLGDRSGVVVGGVRRRRRWRSTSTGMG